MINLAELYHRICESGYSEEMAEAKLCQDIILMVLSKSKFNRNITIKGGVVMRSLSNNVRRATVDIDFDLIKYPLTVKGIRDLIKELNCIDDIKIKIVGKIEDLKHQDYNGKRIHVFIKDNYKNTFKSKIDIGVHKHLLLKQEEYCFDVSALDECASLMINSKEQMVVEKLKSLLRFGEASTRYKDIYDIYFLIDKINKEHLLCYLDILIFKDKTINVDSVQDIIDKTRRIFSNSLYLEHLKTSNRNWLNIANEEVLKSILDFFVSLI